MLAPPKPPKRKAGPIPAPDNKKQQQQKAETLEVAGRHKNDGQKDHKGAR